MVHGRSSRVSHGGMRRVYAGALRCQSGDLRFPSMKNEAWVSWNAGILLEQAAEGTRLTFVRLLGRRRA